MSEDQRFKTMRHIETVRNYLNMVMRVLMRRAELHDQSKLQEPERSMYDEFTPKLRRSTYGSEEYNGFLKEMGEALKHHYANNRHHPEHHQNGIKDMNLIDLIEMLCDWKAATLRHADGDIIKSIKLNQQRFGYSNELRQIFDNTVKDVFDEEIVYHNAQES